MTPDAKRIIRVAKGMAWIAKRMIRNAKQMASNAIRTVRIAPLLIRNPKRIIRIAKQTVPDAERMIRIAKRTVHVASRTTPLAFRTIPGAFRTAPHAKRIIRIAIRTVPFPFRIIRFASGTVRFGLREAADGSRMAQTALDGRASVSVCFLQEDTMTQEEYEERRHALEAQHRTDVALLNAAQELRLRALERLWRNGVEEERDAAASVVPAAAVQPAPAAPAPSPKPMRARYSVVSDLAAALPGLPGIFDRHDIIRALGYVPARTTLLRALDMLKQEGVIAVEDQSPGGLTNRYRKTAAAD